MIRRLKRKPSVQRPIVFLHIPKTAGQTIHHAVGSIVGQEQISPIRVHSETKSGETQLPPGYSFYSGHIDWTDLEQLPKDRFVFTVLRDPRERIASFYFYLRKEAQQLASTELSSPGHFGKRRILTKSVDDYFFSEDPSFRRFIQDHYDNFYCAYLATRRIRGYAQMQDLTTTQKVARALTNVGHFDQIYHLSQLSTLERDVTVRFGITIKVAKKFLNQGDLPVAQRRWPVLLDRFESDANRSRLESFVTADIALMSALDLPSDPG